MEYPTYLIHYGIPGQKWGVRRYQNPDGSLTPEGYEHYGREKARSIEQKELYKQIRKSGFTEDVYNNSLYSKMVRDNAKYYSRMQKIKKISEEREKIHKEIRNSKPNEHDINEAKELFWKIHGYYPKDGDKKDQKRLKLDIQTVMNYNANRDTRVLDLESKLDKLYKNNDYMKTVNSIIGKYGDKRIKTKGHKGSVRYSHVIYTSLSNVASK